mgnify:CR=1 FL=1
MCSMTLTSDLNNQLAGLGPRDAEIIKNGMKRRAWDANQEMPGILDDSRTNLESGFAKDLRHAGVRKERIGRHRVFFVGRNIDCNYTGFYVKTNKQGDNQAQDDNNPSFHNIVRNALQGVTEGEPEILQDPQELIPEDDPPDWKKTDWYKLYEQYKEQS